MRALRRPSGVVSQQLDLLLRRCSPFVHPAPSWLTEAARLAERHGLTFYDASWAAAAEPSVAPSSLRTGDSSWRARAAPRRPRRARNRRSSRLHRRAAADRDGAGLDPCPPAVASRKAAADRDRATAARPDVAGGGLVLLDVSVRVQCTPSRSLAESPVAIPRSPHGTGCRSGPRPGRPQPPAAGPLADQHPRLHRRPRRQTIVTPPCSSSPLGRQLRLDLHEELRLQLGEVGQRAAHPARRVVSVSRYVVNAYGEDADIDGLPRFQRPRSPPWSGSTAGCRHVLHRRLAGS